MTGNTSDERAHSAAERRRRAGVVLAAVLINVGLLALLTASTAAPAAAQANNSTAGYYNGSTATVDNQTWMAGREDATLDDQVAMLTRLSTVIVGSGPTTQGGGGPAGVLVFGFILMGSATALVGRSRSGAVGGAALFVALAGGIVSLGFAPSWMWAVILLGVGVIVTAAAIRSV